MKLYLQDGSFNVADEDGNIAFRIDEDGTKSRKYNLCDDHGNILCVVKESFDGFGITDINNNYVFKIDAFE